MNFSTPRFAFVLLVSMLFAAGASAQEAVKPPRQYKRVHQQALMKIVNGDLDAAEKQLTDFIAKYPEDGETHYMLAVLRCKQGKLDAAFEHMEKAIGTRDATVPVMRFLGGTKTLLDPLRQTEPVQILSRELKHALVHGPMLGQMTGDSVSIWVRTVGEAELRVEALPIIRGEKRPPIESKPVRSSRASDYTAVIQLAGLQPNTSYTYTVSVDGKPEIDARTREVVGPRTFRTLSKTGDATKFTFAFGGGAGFVPFNERQWDTIRSKGPDALVLLGDNIYSDSPKVPENQHFSYYRRQSRPEYRKLIQSIPVYAIWDDHDFGTNDCQGGPEIDVPEWKRPVYEVYRNNWVNAYYGGGDKHPGIYFDFYIGDVHFIMLDGRYYRHLDGKTMLGPVQKQWLFDTLKDSKGTFKVLASPVPWAAGTKGGSRDTWDGFPEERKEIYDFLHANKIEGVVQISADRHRSDLWKNERENGYPIYEFNSSRLTNQHVHPEMKKAVFSYNKKQSFGLVEVDTTADDPTMKYSIITIDGETVFSFTVKCSMLK